MNIHVLNLSLNVIDTDLMKLFSAFGKVNSAIIIRDINNGRSKGTALIDMPDVNQADQAILCLNKMVIDGSEISVSEVKYSIRNYKN
jgi:RNA recognition motif-containing protein